MKSYKGYLIDLDGTMYYGEKRIPTAENFVKKLVEKNIPFLFVTNNATKTPEEVAENLRENYQLPVSAEHVYTSALAMMDYLSIHHKQDDIYVIGEPSLHKQVEDLGLKINQNPNAKVVVQALNRHTDYDELAGAALAIRGGASFLVTNTDIAIPTAEGLKPSSGAITAFLEYTTQVSPIVMGKPHKPIMTSALHRMGLKADEVLMVGDNYATDIRSGINSDIDTLLVLTGVTQKEEVKTLPIAPTYVINDLSEWNV